MEQLNNLEIALLETIIEENKNNYPFLKLHVPHLALINREYTGVGIYSNFGYMSLMPQNNLNVLLTSAKRLIINGLQNEVTYVLDITLGNIKFLEIVANGDEVISKGDITNFKLL